MNQYASLDAGGSITNTATISGPGVTNDILVSETINTADTAL